MHSKLESYIDELGGKHGCLAFLREQPGGAQYVPPSEILKPEDSLTWGTWQKVRAACRDHKTDKAIVRTSQRADWQGMVDTMPTVVVEASMWGYFHARSVLSKFRKECQDPRLEEYSRAEGTNYDPEGVTVSFTPHFSGTTYSLTEHPNQDRVVLVDRIDPFFYSTLKKARYISSEIIDGAVRTERLPTPLNIDHLLNWIRSCGAFDENTSLQIEQGSGQGGEQVLFQVKDFALKRTAGFSLSEEAPWILAGGAALSRNFGITTPEGVVLARTSLQPSRKGMKDLQVEAPFLYWLESASAPLELDEYHPQMFGYVLHRGNDALSHQNTRFIQASLRRGGIAKVSPGSFGLNPIKQQGKDGKVRVISDGYRWVVQPA